MMLQRSLKVMGALLITLSATTPASSVFIIVPDVLHEAGSGALAALLIAAVVATAMACVYAETASAFPLSGGEYAIVGRTLGRLPGFMVLGLNLVTSVTTGAVFALGIGEYLQPLFPGVPALPIALVTIAGSTLLGALNIRTSALVTGLFLAVELLALAVLAALGFSHPVHPLGEALAHPAMLSASGVLVPTSVGAIGLAVAVAAFAYDGYGSAVYFGEELHEAPRRIARAILWALAIAVVCELVPVAAVLTGAPDLKGLLSARNPFLEFIATRGGHALAAAVSLGIALAIVNAAIAVLLLTARQLYSTGRDRVWFAAADRALAATHPRFHSPLAATLAAGALTAATCFVGLNLLLVITGTGIVAVYAALCAAALAGRRTGRTSHAAFRMPLFPWLPIAGLLALAYVIYADWLDAASGRPSLIFTAAVLLLCAAYYLLVLKRRGTWTLRGPEPERNPGAPPKVLHKSKRERAMTDDLKKQSQAQTQPLPQTMPDHQPRPLDKPPPAPSSVDPPKGNQPGKPPPSGG